MVGDLDGLELAVLNVDPALDKGPRHRLHFRDVADPAPDRLVEDTPVVHANETIGMVVVVVVVVVEEVGIVSCATGRLVRCVCVHSVLRKEEEEESSCTPQATLLRAWCEPLLSTPRATLCSRCIRC